MEMQKSYENLTVTGFVDDVRPYIASTYLYVCPIRDGGGTKLKVLDALAMGKLLIANPIACEGISVEDGKNVIFAATPDEYVSAIKDAFADPEKAHRIASSAHDLIKTKYNFQKIGEDLSFAFERTGENNL